MNDYEYFDDAHPLHDDDDDDDRQFKKPRTKKRNHPVSTMAMVGPLDLTVVGTMSTIHRDDDMAEQIHQGKHLIEYVHFDNQEADADADESSFQNNEEEQYSLQTSQADVCPKTEPLLLDRYDVRTLLEDLQIFEKPIHEKNKNTADDADDADDTDLNEEERRVIYLERYGDLKLEEESVGVDVDCAHKVIGRADEKVPATCTSPFELSESDFSDILIPNGVKPPETKREYDIIKMTAGKVRERPQFEVLLKVKEADNPDFSFLQTMHHLNPFYQWLKCGKQVTACTNKMDNKTEHEEAEAEADNSMGLLNMYGSTSSEDESEEGTEVENELAGAGATSLPDKSSAGVLDNNIASDQTEEKVAPGTRASCDKEKRAKRLKRAKMLRHHFSNR